METGKDEAAQARFKEDLLTQLEASEDKTTREIAAKAKTYSQKKRNPLTFLREIVCGVGSATSFLADAPNAVATLTAITTAVTTVVTQYGPEIAKILPQIPILSI